MAASRPLTYRPDIDGLRAIAVLSVVFYHLGLPLHGGFVGVDLFFVISGFLIGSILLRQTADGSFTFAGFYERRIRRIVPALAVMLAISSAAAWRYLLPSELADYARSLIAAVLSVSNMLFWRQSGYFASASSLKPLLHTWSLSVEEQFYVFFPLLLVGLRRWAPRRIGPAICGLAALSFAVSVWGAFRFPTATFYCAPLRAWELLLGTMLALPGCPMPQRAWSRLATAFTGLLLIAGSLWFLHAWTPFPGLAALPPCLGAALIINGGRTGPTLVGRALGLPPVRFVGLISYSLYLWHWPVMVFNSLGLTWINGLTRHEAQALEFGISLVLAVLSWRFVETPFRHGGQRLTRRRVFAGAAAMGATLCLAAGAALASHGADGRFSPEARAVAAYLDPDAGMGGGNTYRNGTCFITAEPATLADFARDTCLAETPGRPGVLLLGDSHAAALWWGLDQALKDRTVLQATASGCKPVLRQRPRQQAGCTAIMSYALREYLPAHRNETVLIAAHWDEGDLSSLEETLAWLRRNKIHAVLLGPIVQYDSALPRLLALSINEGDPQLPRRHLLRELDPLDLQMQALADAERVPYVSLLRMFCAPDDTCLEYARPGVPLQWDYGHLTQSGSVLAAERMRGLGVLPPV